MNEDEHTLRVVVREVAVDDHAELRVGVVDPLAGYRVEGAANTKDVARIRQAGVDFSARASARASERRERAPRAILYATLAAQPVKRLGRCPTAGELPVTRLVIRELSGRPVSSHRVARTGP